MSTKLACVNTRIRQNRLYPPANGVFRNYLMWSYKTDEKLGFISSKRHSRGKVLLNTLHNTESRVMKLSPETKVMDLCTWSCLFNRFGNKKWATRFGQSHVPLMSNLWIVWIRWPDNNINRVVSFHYSSFKDNDWTSLKIRKSVNTTSTSQVLVYFGKEGLRSNTPFINPAN